MSDRSDFDHEQFIRRVGRPMKVHPEALLRQLQPQGFVLTAASRTWGLNELQYLRPTPDSPGLFDLLELKGDTTGNHLAVYVAQGLVAHPTPFARVSQFVPVANYGRRSDKIFSDNQAIEMENGLGQAVPALFAELHERAGRAFYEETAAARAAAERYLQTLQPSADLNETLQRLRSMASEEQWQQTLEYIRRDSITPLNMVDFRTVWEIAGLCQVLYWDRDAEFRGIPGEVPAKQATADDREAHFRLHIVASRLARAPGWPIVDPLVPNRCDLEDTIVWRDMKPRYVAQVFDKYLATIDRRCACGKCLYYVRHNLHDQEPRTAEVLARCNNGHEETIEFAAAGLGNLSSAAEGE
ncbi:hypothetical protein [Anatilimnocola floriformis]|uniref:hypothetical protein n=1 Tax=Anatilimnocola floriformis TaxID=2948575 RepID=UPI0020C1F393|nr:hypothetical protein [Anatilimnocola floriformis]